MGGVAHRIRYNPPYSGRKPTILVQEELTRGATTGLYDGVSEIFVFRLITLTVPFEMYVWESTAQGEVDKIAWIML